EGVAEAEKCAWVCDYYADQAAAILADQPRQTDAARSYVRFEAIGPVLAIMPWNFPFWQVFRFAAPALAAGNAGLLKHAPNVSRCALDAAQVLRDAGQFTERLTAEMASRRVGDPLDPATAVGPQARLDLRANLHRQVEESVRRGAQLVLGGRLPDGPGAFYPPTVLTAVRPGTPA